MPTLFMFVGILAELVVATPIYRVMISAGHFFYGAGKHDPDAEADEKPGRSVTLPAFSIDRTEVTRSAYASCVAAGRCPARADLTPLDLFSRLPMTQVSYLEASAYCKAANGKLPSERQWERAARGAKDDRRFPWSDEPSCARANFGNFEGEGRCPENPGRPVEVGKYPAGATREGVQDLAGNVWEWTRDLYAPGRRSVRGGACCSMFGLPRVSNRIGFPEDYRDDDLGFRCVGDEGTLRR